MLKLERRFTILDIAKKILDESPDIETAKTSIENFISENYIAKQNYISEKNNFESLISKLQDANKSLTFKNFLEKNGCLDSEFIIYKESNNLDDFLNLDDENKKNYINKIKKNHPFLFKNNCISGANPPENSNMQCYITKDDFKKMSYKEKTDLFNNNRSLYESFI